MKKNVKSRLLALVTAFALIIGQFAGAVNAMENKTAGPMLLEDQVEVKIEKTENGSVKFYKDDVVLDDESLLVNKDEKVTLEVKAGEGFELEKLESKTEDGKVAQLEVKDEKAELVVTENTVISSTFKTVKAEEEQKTEQSETTDDKQETQPVKEEKVVEENKSEAKENTEAAVNLMPSKSEEVQATTTVEQYLKSNVNSQYANVKAFKIAGSMTIAPTMATADTASLDDLWAEQNIDKFKSAGYSTAALYDVDKDSAYYVAYVQSDVTDAKLVQALAAKNNTNAELRKDVIYENGIAYVPKKYDPNNDTRMQLLYATNETSEAKTEVTVKNNNVEGDFVENLIVTSKLDSNLVKFNITKGNTKLDYYDIKSLKINGKEEVNNLSLWAINDSTIIINGVPASINKVEIELAKETLLIKAGAPAWYTSPVMTLPGTWEFGHEPQVGEVIKIYNTKNTYFGKKQAARTGYYYGADANWMASGSIHTKIVHAGLGWDSPNLDNLNVYSEASFRTASIPAQTVGDIKIPSVPEFTMICSHIGVNANLEYEQDYNNNTESDPGLRVRVIAKHGNKLLCAFVVPTSFTQAGAGLYMIQYQSGGEAQVLKTSANPDAKALTDLCPLYTLAGAEYTFYADAECTVVKGTVTTVADGSSNKIKLPAGTYFVKETKAPFGYILDSKVYTATVVSGQTTTVDVKDRPMLDPIRAVVQKTIEEGADKNLSVKGAEFEFKYYPTLGDITKSEAIRTWNFATNEKGNVYYDDNFKISGDELFKYKDAPIGIIGTYTIKETKAPKGLALDERTIYVRIAPNADGTDTTMTYSEDAEFTNPKEIKKGEALFDQIEKTQKVNLHLQKVDAETKQPVPQGYGTLEGAIYSVFRFDPLAAEDEFVADIVTDAAGKAVLEGLAPSRYIIKEKTPSKGYTLDETVITLDARIKELNTAFFDYFATSEEIPTNVYVRKVFTNWDGEKEDVKGARLQLFDGDTMLEEWTTDGDLHVIKGLEDGKTYTIKEVFAPKGLKLAEPKQFTVNGVLTDVEIEDGLEEPEIGTVATDKHTSTHVLSMDNEIVDTIKYTNMQPDTDFTVKAKLYDAKADKVLEDVYEMKWHSPKAKDGDYTVDGEIEMPIKAKESLEGKTIVVFEYIEKNDKPVAKHEDKKAKMQTVYSPSIKTLATAQDGSHFLDGTKKEQKILEKMFTSNLVVGEEYTTKAKIAVVPTTEASKEAQKFEYVQKDGKDYELEKTFVADAEDMTHDFEFEIDATEYASDKLVVVEELYHKGKLVGRHAKLDNEDQTVRVSMILDVNIAKADADNVGHFLKGAEITVFTEDGKIAKTVDGKDAVGVSDENGKVSFSIPYSFEHKYYVQETKAPNGYNINNEKFEVKPTGQDKLGTDLIKINVLDEAIIIPPTGVSNNIIIAGALFTLALAGLALYACRRKK